jgi:hypothetical protein
MSDAAQKWAIVTPTYHLDYEQFKLMCESMDHFVEGQWHHYVVVTKADYAMFAPFNGPRRTVIENTEILPPWLRYIGKLGRVRSGSFWFSHSTDCKTQHGQLRQRRCDDDRRFRYFFHQAI